MLLESGSIVCFVRRMPSCFQLCIQFLLRSCVTILPWSMSHYSFRSFLKWPHTCPPHHLRTPVYSYTHTHTQMCTRTQNTHTPCAFKRMHTCMHAQTLTNHKHMHSPTQTHTHTHTSFQANSTPLLPFQETIRWWTTYRGEDNGAVESVLISQTLTATKGSRRWWHWTVTQTTGLSAWIGIVYQSHSRSSASCMLSVPGSSNKFPLFFSRFCFTYIVPQTLAIWCVKHWLFIASKHMPLTVRVGMVEALFVWPEPT